MATAPTGLYEVRRPFISDGERMVPGVIVDVTEWRNAYQLLDRGYLKPTSLSDVTSDVMPAKKAPAKKAVKKAAPKPASRVEKSTGL